ncbi:glycine cleavage system H protein [Lampropedia hyalina DSM 16112]|uniref:Glycine cleavage system H protein n=1 Tax=Lampropedia hyalina DSM 16112 TaxID=1122156 RepID=A0A1M4XVX1_9BURK|nr:glycine cleavage system protein GcvH [Lampropedia hyalina]SHE97727.1 glycine cleavage system H protein [Lampropedia hyalina DSM 16112]
MGLKFSKDHTWVDDSNVQAATVGITVHAQETLGDVVFVDLPAIGQRFQQGDVVGVVESVKAAADVLLPVAGEIVAVNEALRDDPSLANTDPLGAGWFVRIAISAPEQLDGLLQAQAYSDFSANA